jgi:hypothetical protein
VSHQRKVHSVHNEQNGSESSTLPPDDVDAAEFLAWLQHVPREFEIEMEYDKETVGVFQWAFELVQYTAMECAEYTLRNKDLSIKTRKSFCYKLPRFVKNIQKYGQPRGTMDPLKHKRIYKWTDFVTHVIDDHNHNALAKIMHLCDQMCVGYIRFYVGLAIAKLTAMYELMRI